MILKRRKRNDGCFDSMESDLDKTLKQYEFLKDRLLEATLAEDVKNHVITSYVSNVSKTADTSCNDAFDVSKEMSKRIVDLEKNLSKLEARSIASEIALQHKSQENNSLKTLQKENENFLASLQIEKAHLKQTYKDLFESVQSSRVKTNQCDEVKVKFDFAEIESKNIELVKMIPLQVQLLRVIFLNLKESGENNCENAKCELRTKIVELEKEINHLRTQLENLKGKSVETKFDKPSVLGKPLADKLLVNSQISKSWFTPKVVVQKDLSKPVNAQSLPKNEKRSTFEMNCIFRIKVGITRSSFLSKEIP
ncbi:hypothetical protein Tco_0773536 [Tanacetum coccineum]|uniref:Uncharacterized protein n=1 Tax=Tanacetum coccineum TaxID=301880 RepID=A0ABQ4ZL54_9ASTR